MYLGNAITEREIQELEIDLSFVKNRTTKAVIEKAIYDKKKHLALNRKLDFKISK